MKRIKFSTKDIAEKRAYDLALSTKGRARKFKSKKQKYKEKISKWYYRGY